MKFTNDSLIHIEEVMDDAGYPLCGRIPAGSQNVFVVVPYSLDGIRYHDMIFRCDNIQRAKAAVRSLLNRAGVYEVVVHSPLSVPTSWYNHFDEMATRCWKQYYSC